MYLGLITLPLMAGVITGVIGRHLGRRGGIAISTQSIIIATIVSVIGYYEIAISGSPISVFIREWIETEYLALPWGINIDTLSISIYIPVLIVSSCVQIYSADYMKSDPHNPRFYTYLSLFSFFMLVLISGDNLLTIFIGVPA